MFLSSRQAGYINRQQRQPHPEYKSDKCEVSSRYLTVGSQKAGCRHILTGLHICSISVPYLFCIPSVLICEHVPCYTVCSCVSGLCLYIFHAHAENNQGSLISVFFVSVLVSGLSGRGLRPGGEIVLCS